MCWRTWLAIFRHPVIPFLIRSVELFPFQVSLLRKVRVSTEMSLYVLAYNMKRVIKLLVHNG